MKALAILTAAAVTLFSVATFAQYGAPYGKGKAPPPPVVSMGRGSVVMEGPVPFFLG